MYVPSRRRRRRSGVVKYQAPAPGDAAAGQGEQDGGAPAADDAPRPRRPHPGAPHVTGGGTRGRGAVRQMELLRDPRGHSSTRNWHRWAMPTLLICVTMMRLLFAAHMPLAPDETYYWVWSRALAWGYPDHPPMVAFWIAAGTSLVGELRLGVRLLAPLAVALGSWMLSQAAQDLAPTPGRAGRAAVIAPVLLNATLALNAGAVIMTPDTPLLFFWCAALFCLARLLATGVQAWWLAAGLAIGLAGLSKLTILLPGLGILLWLLASPAQRPRLRGIWPWAGAGVALLTFLPFVLWNAAHDWIGFTRQGGRVLDVTLSGAPRYLAELVFGQLGLATPAVAALFVLGVRRLWRDARQVPAHGLLIATILVPLAVFLQHALGARVQANWPVVIYPSLALAAGVAGLRYWREAAWSGAAISLIILLQASFAPLPLAPAPLKRIGGWDRFGQAVHIAAGGANAAFVAAEEYGLASELAYHMGGPVAAVDPRWRHFSLPRAGIEMSQGLLVIRDHDPPPDPARWGKVEYLRPVYRQAYGHLAETYQLYRVAPVLPMPDAVRLAPRRWSLQPSLDMAPQD